MRLPVRASLRADAQKRGSRERRITVSSSLSARGGDEQIMKVATVFFAAARQRAETRSKDLDHL